jgi:hypothetical protein
MAYGTLSTLDTLAAVRQSVIAYGEDLAWQAISVALDAHNSQVNEMMGALVERTTDARRSYGTGDTKTMDELDQWGLSDAQKISAAVTVDFPLRRYGNPLQWTRQWMVSNSAAQLAAEVTAIFDADRNNIIRQVKRAVYTTANSTFIDKLGYPANVSLAVKAFANNDGSGYPLGPNGETFATSHNHYLANATLTTTVATNLITAVQEHYNTGQPVVVINSADEAGWRALTGFVALVDPRVTLNTAANQPILRANYTDLYNRDIGYYGNALIRIRPWAIANYAFAYIEGQAPVLAMRVPSQAPELGNLNFNYEDERMPLRARNYERQFGVGVWQRVGGAVLQFNNGTYSARQPSRKWTGLGPECHQARVQTFLSIGRNGKHQWLRAKTTSAVR